MVEDIFMLAMEVKTVLETAGAEVVGPFATSEGAEGSLEGRLPDCALLDANLGRGSSFDLARALRVRGVPFLFFTGYDPAAIPAEFADVRRLEKPLDTSRLLAAVAGCMQPHPAA